MHNTTLNRQLLNGARAYLQAHIRRHGHQRTAERFGVSRQTLWRFLNRDQAGRSLPEAVLASVGGSVEALKAAAWALEPGPTPARWGATRRGLRPVQAEALLALCETPLATVDELARFNRLPASTLRERLAKLSERGLVDSRPHRLGALGPRPQRRFFPTEQGVLAAAGDSSEREQFLRAYPVSRQWFRLLAERLDAVAVLYHVADIIAEADPERQPVRVDHYRQGPYDMLLSLSGSLTVGLLRQGPMLTAANLRFRLRSIERLDVRERPRLTLVLTDSEQDVRRAVRALADPWQHETTFAACEAELAAGGAQVPVFQQGGYGFPNTPTIAPDADLASILAWMRRRTAAEAQNGPAAPELDPDALYRADVRATPPQPAAQLDRALSLQLTRAEKQALDLLAAWPLATPEQLAGLMGGVTRRRANQLFSSLRRCLLVQAEPHGYALTDTGLTALAHRDRAAVGPVLDRWTPQRSEGVYVGSALRALASQLEHQRGITEFAARLSAETARDPDYELIDLLPTHRSQITYWHAGRSRTLHPDASFQLSYLGDWLHCLLEFERRAVTPKRVPERLRSYLRYFKSGCAQRDHGGLLPFVLFVFETAAAEEAFHNAAVWTGPAPIVSSHTEALREQGVLGESWRPPPPQPSERRRLHDPEVGAAVQSTRAERFL